MTHAGQHNGSSPSCAAGEPEAALLDELRSIVLRWGTDGCIHYINRFGAELFGFQREDLIGRHVIGTIVAETESTGRDLVRMIEDITRNPARYADNENENITSDGKRLWIQWSNKPIFDENGHLSEILSVGQDMTERQQTQRALHALAASTRLEGNRFFEELVLLLSQAYGTHFAMITLLEPSDDPAGLKDHELSSIAFCADGQIQPPLRYPIRNSPCEMALRQGSAHIERDLGHKFPEDRILRDLDIESYYALRLELDGRAAGVITVFDRKPLELQPWNRELLHIFADRATAELKRQQQERELRLAAEVFHNSNEGIVIADERLRIQRVNKAFTEMTGFRDEDLVGRSAFQLAKDANDRRLMREIRRGLRQYGYWWGEVRNGRRDGSTHPAWLSISSIPGRTGRISHYVALFTDISEQKQQQERIYHLARHDGLTGLLNRNSMLEAMSNSLETSSHSALLYIDLDRFKPVNDRYGHSMGDEVLREVARRLRHSIRGHDLLARMGGDEFAILLRELDGEHIARDVAEQTARRLLRVLSRIFRISGNEARLSASIGIALHDSEQGPFTAEELLYRADIAMYHIKRDGKSGYRFFDPSMAARAHRRMMIEERLRTAVMDKKVGIHLQPILDLHSGQIRAVEALARWQDDDGKEIPVEEFIHIAEETGLILALGQHIIEQSIAVAASWARLGHEIACAVNLSLRQLSEQDLALRLRHLLNQHQLSPELLVLEITESSMMDDETQARAILENLANTGIALSIDDFGTGYSSLAHLRRFPVSSIKIDRSFVEEIDSLPPREQQIIDAAIALGHGMGLRVIAEGVTTEEQKRFLEARGCDCIQGFLVSPPLPPEECLAFIQAWNG